MQTVYSCFLKQMRFAQSIGLLVLMLVLCSCSGAERSQNGSGSGDAAQRSDDARPNIVVIMADDMGYSDLGSYGATVIQTPHLDRMAQEGLRFTQFYNNSKCTQSRASLLSGLYYQQTENLKLQNHVTVAEVLEQAGYRTITAGKWHLDGPPPSERGFERNFGFLGGLTNYFTGKPGGPWRLNGKPYEVPEDDFYATHAFTDYSIEFVNEAVSQDKPFFLYLAYNAPHWPLHAPEETIDKYRGKFMMGWESLREQRYERQLDTGVIEEKWALASSTTPARYYPSVPDWNSLSAEQQRSQDLFMAVYAAMIDEMDRDIGRLVRRLDELGEKENTLVIFLSDNGGCPYSHHKTPDVPPGPADSWHTYDTQWAYASNTPFRGYKRQSLEGGTATPFIVSWPAAIGADRQGQITGEVGHLIDLMPTFLEVAEADYPSRYDGHEVLPLEGRSLLPVFRGEPSFERDPVFWEFRRHAGVRQGQWKLVGFRNRDWKLYDMNEDRTELHDLSKERPEKRADLIDRYTRWAERVGAKFPKTK